MPALIMAEAAESTSQRVNMYLLRVVSALAQYEDALIREDGFFARSDHFEAQVDNLRAEFDANERAVGIFSMRESVMELVVQLTSPPADGACQRQLQLAFASSVLLTSNTTMRTIREHPALLTPFWAFIKQQATLDCVQLQYWYAPP